MNKEKIFILQKDVPDAKAGSKYIFNSTYHRYYLDGNVKGSYWDKEWVENNPEWFKLQEEVKTIVTSINPTRDEKSWCAFFKGDKYFKNGLEYSQEAIIISKERLAEILIAENKGLLFMDHSGGVNKTYYSEKEILEIEEKAFNAARESEKKYYGIELSQQNRALQAQKQMQDDFGYYEHKYKEFKNYKDSKQKQ